MLKLMGKIEFKLTKLNGGSGAQVTSFSFVQMVEHYPFPLTGLSNQFTSRNL
jgi:hypothetical protein